MTTEHTTEGQFSDVEDEVKTNMEVELATYDPGPCSGDNVGYIESEDLYEDYSDDDDDYWG